MPHKGWTPLPDLLPSPLRKQPNLVPKLSAKSAAEPALALWRPPNLQPSLRLESPFQWPPSEHVQPFKVKYSRQKKWHTVPVSR